MMWVAVRIVLFALALWRHSAVGMFALALWTMLDFGVLIGRRAERRRR